MSFASIRVAIILIVGWNLVAWMPEWLLLRKAWTQSASLRYKHALYSMFYGATKTQGSDEGKECHSLPDDKMENIMNV